MHPIHSILGLDRDGGYGMVQKITNNTKAGAVRPKKSSPLKRISLIAGSTVLGIALVAAALFFIGANTVWSEQATMERYLHDKYDKAFVVEDIRANAIALGGQGQRISNAHPADDTALRFEVVHDKDARSFSDGYVGALWAREERPRVQVFLESVYGVGNVPEFKLVVKQDEFAKNVPTIKGSNIPTLTEAYRQLNGNIYYFISIMDEVNESPTNSSLLMYTDRVKRIATFLLDKHVSAPRIVYGINVKDQKLGYTCNISEEALKVTSQIESCFTKVNGRVW